MTRYTIEGSPISVAYGEDKVTGVFLSVFDSRLEYQDNVSAEVNEVAESIGVKDGGGGYFDLHTGKNGFGKKVSKETMRVYFSRYGVKKQHIDKLLGTKKEDESKLQSCENAMESLKIFDCYLPKECDLDLNQNLINDTLPFPIKKPPTGSIIRKSIYAIYLPETGIKPILVDVPIKVMLDKNGKPYEDPQIQDFIGKGIHLARSCMPYNPLNEKRVMSNTLEINYRDNFLVDGRSKKNEVVQKITKGMAGYDWRGPMIVLKFKGVESFHKQDHLDIELTDFPDIVDFLLWYGR